MSHAQHGSLQVASLAHALSWNRSLTEVSLRGIAMTVRDVDILAEALCVQGQVRSLRIRQSGCGPEAGVSPRLLRKPSPRVILTARTCTQDRI